MKILEDKIEFETADFDGLSDFAKKAASAYLGDYAAYFSARVNRDIDISKAHLKSLTASDHDALLAGLASADEAKLLEAQPLLEQLNTLLNPK